MGEKNRYSWFAQNIRENLPLQLLVSLFEAEILLVEPLRRGDGVVNPVDHDVGKQFVQGESLGQVAVDGVGIVLVGPRGELLQDVGCQTQWRAAESRPYVKNWRKVNNVEAYDILTTSVTFAKYLQLDVHQKYCTISYNILHCILNGEAKHVEKALKSVRTSGRARRDQGLPQSRQGNLPQTVSYFV